MPPPQLMLGKATSDKGLATDKHFPHVRMLAADTDE
jgi:hypothetical protein